MGLIQADLPQQFGVVYGHGQGQAERWLIWKEARLTLHLLSLNRLSRLSGNERGFICTSTQSMEKKKGEQDLQE